LKNATIARNYAEALLAAATAKGARQVEQYGALIEAVAGAVQADERIAVVLESPRVAKPLKSKLLADALEGHAPAEFVRFLQAVVRRGRQAIFADIAQEYLALLDIRMNRVHAGVTLTDQPDAKLQAQIVERLSAAIGKEVRAHFRTDPRIIGGVMVRVGDRIYDGTMRRRLLVMKRRMLTGE